MKLGLRASGGPVCLGHRGEDPRYSSCEYEVPVLDWKGHSDWIKARGVSYTTPSERRDLPEGAREAFPGVAWAGMTVSQEEGPVDMIIGRDNMDCKPMDIPGWRGWPEGGCLMKGTGSPGDYAKMEAGESIRRN